MPPYQSVKYSFTVTLQNKMYVYKPEEQYDFTYLELIKRLKALGATFTIIAELTLNGNLHYHGIITFHQRSKSHSLDFKNVFRTSKIFGYSNIKQIEDYEGWVEYIIKELHNTKDILCRPPIVYDDNKIVMSSLDGYIQDLPKDIIQ